MSEQRVSAEDRSAGLIGFALGIRLLIDTGVQIFNPFLAIIATGLGVNLIVMGGLVSLRSTMGLFSPIFGNLAERWGYRFVMRLTLFMTAVGLLLIGLSYHIWLATIGIMIMGIGSFAFVPVLQAYLSNQLPYASRSRGLAVVEYSWAFAGIIGLFGAGQLISYFGWRSPFLVLGVALLIGWLFFARLPITQTKKPPKPSEAIDSSQTWYQWSRTYLDLGANWVSAWATIIVAMLHSFAANAILIIHGEWLSREYGLGAAELGTISLLTGASFLLGSVLVSVIGDRFGKRRSVLWGTASCVLTYALLPFSNTTLELAVLSLVVALFCFEFAFVSNIALLSEQYPAQRAKLFTLSAAIGLLGVTFSGLTAPSIYTEFSMWGIGSVSTITMILCLLTIILWVKEPEQVAVV